MLTNEEGEGNCIHATEIDEKLDKIINSADDSSKDSLVKMLDLYLESPTLLDSFLKDWIEKTSTALLEVIKEGKECSLLCECLYAFCKIRGYKWISQFMIVPPKEAQTVINWSIKCFKSSLGAVPWHARYIAALWSARFMLTPFPLSRVLPAGQHAELFQLLLKVVEEVRGDGGREVEGVAYFFALLSRRQDWPKEKLLSLIRFQSQAQLDCLIQIVKQADGSFLSEHLEELKEAASRAPLKYQLKLLSHLASVQEELQLTCYFEGLQAKETGLRWTAAKALVRACPTSAVEMVTERIGQKIAVELEREVSSGLEGSPAALHGYLLAIGRFIHHGKLTSVSKQLLAALFRCLRFDQVKGSYAVGSFVRDAACYVAWTASRCSLDAESVDELAGALTCLALFDREVSCRRAGAAALQELVGRGGCHDLLPVLEVIHFSSVSTLASGFRQNLLKVLQSKPDWTSQLAQHLLQVSMKNFDAKVRELAGEAFSCCGGAVESLVIEYQRSTDDLLYRHGVLLAMSHFSSEELIPIAQNVNKIPVKSLGFDLLLEAYLKLICKLPFRGDWLVALGTAFKTRNDSIRGVAVDCLQEQALKAPESFSSFFAKCLSGVEAERDVYTQRGHLAALSAIPQTENQCTVLSVLLKAAKQTRPLNDIDRRCEALRAIKRLLGRGMLEDAYCQETLKGALEEGSLMADYTVDMRGDVGSQVRLLAMSVLQTSKLALTPRIINLLLEQSWGRIEKLREAAETFLLPTSEAGEFEGFYRGLVYTAGGLDAQLAAEAITLLKQQSSNAILLNFLKSALKEHNGRLQMPALLTIEQLWPTLTREFLHECGEYLKNVFVVKQVKNIRKLLVAFRVLKAFSANLEDLKGFLSVQAQEHEYPAIKQLLSPNTDQ